MLRNLKTHPEVEHSSLQGSPDTDLARGGSGSGQIANLHLKS